MATGVETSGHTRWVARRRARVKWPRKDKWACTFTPCGCELRSCATALELAAGTHALLKRLRARGATRRHAAGSEGRAHEDRDQPTTATFSSEHRVPVRVAGRHDERGLASCSLPPYAHSPNTHPPTHSPTYFFFFFPVVFLGSCAGTARQGGHRPGYRSAGRSSADGVDRLQGQAV